MSVAEVHASLAVPRSARHVHVQADEYTNKQEHERSSQGDVPQSERMRREKSEGRQTTKRFGAKGAIDTLAATQTAQPASQTAATMMNQR